MLLQQEYVCVHPCVSVFVQFLLGLCVGCCWFNELGQSFCMFQHAGGKDP